MKAQTSTLAAIGTLILLMIWASPAIAQCQICHYWSQEACNDTCQAFTFGSPAHTDCIACCYESCGGGDDDDDDNDLGGHSPIVIDLGKGTLDFTSATDGVLFDIDGDGDRDAISWTDPRAGDGFLVLDRDGNGTIETGRELFGNYTEQPACGRPNGFAALSVFDENRDRLISRSDAIWNRLQIWIDRNQNGRSEANELTDLPAHQILSIDLNYSESRRRDRYGNRLRYRSRVERDGTPTIAVDVFFLRLR